MCATAANLIEDVLPEVAHRPWVLTFPFPWRCRLAQGGALFGVLTRLFVESVERFYEERAARRGACGAVKSGAVTVVQRTSGDMRLNPHLHVVFLDGAYQVDGTGLGWLHLARSDARRCAPCRGEGGAAALRAATPDRKGARRAAAGRPGAAVAQARLR
ncbi:transposase [Sorangium sp. So ce307]